MPKVSATPQVVAVAQADDIGLEDIKSLDAFFNRYPDIADESRARWWIFHRKSNGLEASGALVKRAGRWFVVVPRLRDWLLTDSANAG
jgi:hypothetical protein